MKLTRREFVLAAPAAAAGLSSLVSTQEPAAIHSSFPSGDPLRAREVVGASHTNIARVKELVGASPALAKAAWDWGFGDWESALGAASHVGNREIAQYLVQNGARPDIFFHAMMGHLEAVKAAVAAQPGIQRIPGPHGITLLAHARAGGDQAKSVVAYLEALGDADQKPENLPITDAEKDLYSGRYVFGKGKDDVLTVDKSSQGLLRIRRYEGSGNILNRVEQHAFAPRGGPHVRIRFKVEGGKAVSVTVHDPGPILTGIKE